MDPARKRTIRLVVALTCALLLAGRARLHELLRGQRGAPAQPARAAREPGKTYQLTGKVAEGSWEHAGHRAHVPRRGPRGRRVVPVRYVGQVPDPFREGREIVIDVRKQGATFVGEPDSLVTKCPSKFSAEPNT